MIQVGMDIGGSHFMVCHYKVRDQKLILDSRSTCSVNPNWEAERILGVWSEAISKTISSYVLSNVLGAGMAIPGPSDYYEEIIQIKGVNKYECLYDMNVKNELATWLEMDVSQVRFINDASVFAIAVSMIGKVKSFDRCLAITLGTGLIASFIVNRKPVFSDPLVPKGGFLYDQSIDGVKAGELFPTKGLLYLYYQVSREFAANALEIYQLATDYIKVRETFQLCSRDLGRFLAPFIEEFGAEFLVLGGNISNAFENFKEQLIAELPIAEIHLSGMMDQADLISGALLMGDEYFGELSDLIEEM
ncbi:ROK family protein [Echinicola sp. CAU 1574]|uniref:ROK family protein n=1 Tax=Echinicola arenosa TaxID=2774144 RepID=A0ABR9AHZ9_9BACT|nr:ROK family protein [Echinicola arenosa]MBD8488139.1 ROK family protein [Echinicola arenosa]